MMSQYVELWRHNHNVTVLMPWYSVHGEQKGRAHFATMGVRFQTVRKKDPRKYYGTQYQRISQTAFEELRRLQPAPDIIVFHDWRGVGAYTIMAKLSGLAFATTAVIVTCHTSTLLADRFMARPPTIDSLIASSMEDYTRTYADVVIHVSKEQRELVKAESLYAHHKVVQVSDTRPNFVNNECPYRDGVKRVLGVAFFGRLETLKGFEVFCKAAEGLSIPVYFIGSAPTVESNLRANVLAAQTGGEVYNTMSSSEALTFMLTKNLVAVTPSLYDNAPLAITECICSGIPIVHGSAGGQQSITAKNANMVISGNTTSLRRKLAEIAHDGFIAIDSLRHSNARTVTWYRELPNTVKLVQWRNAVRDCSDITVCIVTIGRDMSALLAAFRSQTCRSAKMEVLCNGCSAQSPRVHISKARNRIIARVTTKYAVLFDDDDVPRADFLERLRSTAEATDADIVTSHCANVDTQSGQVKHISLSVGEAGLAAELIAHHAGKAAMLVKTEFYTRIGGCIPEIEGYPSPYVDYGLYVNAILHGGKIHVVPEPLYNYTEHSANSVFYSSTNFERNMAMRKIVQHICRVRNIDIKLCKALHLTAGIA
jgi:glycosyltransferase involved in cell wall biosynthesis